MKLYDAVRLNADELRSEFAYVTFYKDGRSWESECMWDLNPEIEVDEEEVKRLFEIAQSDPDAVIIDTYDCPWFYSDATLKDLYESVKSCIANDNFSITNFLRYLEV